MMWCELGSRHVQAEAMQVQGFNRASGIARVVPSVVLRSYSIHINTTVNVRTVGPNGQGSIRLLTAESA